MSSPLQVSFVAGRTGPWTVERIAPVVGATLPHADRLAVAEAPFHQATPGAAWRLDGTTSNARYTTRRETDALAARQAGLGRAQAICAALIPIRKSPAWWAMAQDERREVMQETSNHIGIGMDYLPAIARRLHHCRDLGGTFDFLTWFEYAPEDSDAFEHMTARLRRTAEWRFVEREVDVRLSRVAG